MSEEITKLLKKNRPNLATSSVTTYSSMAKNLLKKMDKPLDYVLKNPKVVLGFLKDSNLNTKKSMLAMLVSLTDNDEYRKEMMRVADEVRVQNDKQEKTTKQQENWMDWEEVLQHYALLYKRVLPLWTKTKLTPAETDALMDVVLLSMYVLVPPRRSTDYAKFKLRDIDTSKDNYLGKGKLIFNDYKTDKTYGRQEVKVPPKLKTILNKWATKHNNDYLLFDRQGRPLTNSKITLRLNRIFEGKKISSSMLRHIYLTHLYRDMPALRQMEDTAKDMGHSIDEAMRYAKKG